MNKNRHKRHKTGQMPGDIPVQDKAAMLEGKVLDGPYSEAVKEKRTKRYKKDQIDKAERSTKRRAREFEEHNE